MTQLTLPKAPLLNLAAAFQSVPEPYWPTSAILRIGAPLPPYDRYEEIDPWVVLESSVCPQRRQSVLQVRLCTSPTQSRYVAVIMADGRFIPAARSHFTRHESEWVRKRLLSAEALSVAVLVTRIVEHSQNPTRPTIASTKPARAAAQARPSRAKPNPFDALFQSRK